MAAEHRHGTGSAPIGNHVCQCSAPGWPALSFGDGCSPTTRRRREGQPQKAAEVIYEGTLMKQHFFHCHEFLTKNTYRLVELLSEAETRGLLLDEALTLADTTFWLQMIDWQSKFLSLVLNFTKDPNRKSLRPLIELYGRDRDRMRTEVGILERQLEHRLATFAKPDDALVRKAVTKNQQSPRTTLSRPPRSQRQREPGRHRGGHVAGVVSRMETFFEAPRDARVCGYMVGRCGVLQHGDTPTGFSGL